MTRLHCPCRTGRGRGLSPAGSLCERRRGSLMPSLRLLPELELDVQHIPGVRAASVVTGPDRVPTEVHVLARPGKAPKQLVRDVQSVALTRHDLDIDHRIVSVVQMNDEELGADGVEADEPAQRRL